MTPPASQTAPKTAANSAAWTPPWPGTQADGTAKLEHNGQVYELPVIVGTEGERALDIARLRAQTGLITLDEGFVNTGSSASAITSALSTMSWMPTNSSCWCARSRMPGP